MSKVIGVKLQDEQAGQFERAAKREGKTVSSWLRDLGAAAVAPPPVPQKSQVRISPSGSEFSPSSNIRTPPAFGKSAEAFLAAKGVAPINVGNIMMEDVDPWEEKCTVEFGGPVLRTAAKSVRGWAKLDWQKRYETLKEMQSQNGGTEWA